MQRRFDDLLREYAQFGSLPSFLAPACLVRHGDGESDGENEQPLDTTAMMAPLPRRYSLRTEHTATLGLVYPLIKREGSAFAHIGIGRATNVDVQVPLVGISKYHAYVNIGSNGEFTLADAGSQNGTRLVLERLEPRQPRELASGTRVYLAHYAFTFFTRGGLLEYVRTQRTPLAGGA
ncbi:MAG TPA: FHA domain-containing protein [Polyangiales bacterium]|nr:FHA domain-containing protein [Polyangiales bacterium]